MEGLIQLVSDCLARHGLLPADDPQPGESAATLAAPLPEALPEHNYRKISESPGTAARPIVERRRFSAHRGKEFAETTLG